MKACLVLCIAAALIGVVFAECEACLGGQCYREQRLSVTTGDFLDVDRNTNTLYIMDGFTVTQCKLETGVCNNITDPWDLWVMSVDHSTGNTYGTIRNHSLCKLDFINNEKQILVRDPVNSVAFKDKLYYTLRSTSGLYTYENGVSRIVTGSSQYYVFTFVVDKHNDIYFQTFANGRFIIKRLSKGVVDQSVYWRNIYLITVDRDDNAIFINPDSHAVYRVTDGQLVEIGAINFKNLGNTFYRFRPVFDGDNNVIIKDRLNDHTYLKRDRGVYCTTSTLLNKKVITETVATRRNGI